MAQVLLFLTEGAANSVAVVTSTALGAKHYCDWAKKPMMTRLKSLSNVDSTLAATAAPAAEKAVGKEDTDDPMTGTGVIATIDKSRERSKEGKRAAQPAPKKPLVGALLTGSHWPRETRHSESPKLIQKLWLLESSHPDNPYPLN